MRYIPLEQAQPGMRLAQNIWDTGGRILIAANMLLTERYIVQLMKLGFGGVYIEDELSLGIEIEHVISPSLRAEGMRCVQSGDVDACKDVAARIVEEILEKKDLSLDMTDLRSYDDYTFAHSVNVAVLSCVIGVAAHMRDTDLVQLVTAAILHDLGKLAISQEILNKPGRLTPEEYQIMKSHAQLSYDLIKNRWDLSSYVKQAVLYHHENIDGSGYPAGISGEDQSVFVKILHVADVYDALISKRPYKEPYAPYEAVEYLMGGCGVMFDKEAVELLMRYVPLYPKGSEVILSDGRKGIVYRNEGVYNIRPIVRTLDGELIDLTEPEHVDMMIRSMNETVLSSMKDEEDRLRMIREARLYRVMIVDDNRRNLEDMGDLLGERYEVILMRSGKQAINYFASNPEPDLILMDIDMPGMDGLETTRVIREITHHRVPVVFVTARNDVATVMECRKLGAKGYIVRPYKPIFLKAEVMRLLNGR